MNSKESLISVINSINTGRKFPALRLVNANPEAAALISKLVKPREQAEFNLRQAKTHHNLNQSQIQAVSDNTKGRIRDNENIVALFPDVELAIQILISSILSPKDMVKTDIIYKAKEHILPSEVINKINLIVASHIESYYKLDEEFQDILRATLFTSGSYVKVVLPESTVDEIINDNSSVSTESLSELYNTTDNKTTTRRN